jgi:hypothetical protein
LIGAVYGRMILSKGERIDMRHSAFVCLAAAIVLVLAVAAPWPIAAQYKNGCAVTQEPRPAFIPPPPYGRHFAPPDFLLGSPSLWTIIHHDTWHLGVNDGRKLPYWRQGFDSRKERDPRLSVVARRLDGPAPLIWADSASSAQADDTPDGMAMVTGLDVPTAGCWEISAHYGWSDAASHQWREQTLAYTVWVEP